MLTWQTFWDNCSAWILASIGCMVCSVIIYLVQRYRWHKWQTIEGEVVQAFDDGGVRVTFESEPGISRTLVDDEVNAKVGGRIQIVLPTQKPARAKVKWHPEVWLFVFGLLPFLSFGVINAVGFLSTWFGSLSGG